MRFLKIAAHKVLSKLPSPFAARIAFVIRTGRWPNTRFPQLFNDKVFVAKTTWRDPALVPLVDKVLAKEYVASKLDETWIIPTLFAGPQLPPREDRNWPTPYVIKANHASGWNMFVRSQEDINWDHIEEVTKRWMANAFMRSFGEWPYQQVKRQILVEEMIGRGELPTDFKLFCFSGRVEYIQVDTEREKNHKRAFFNRDWVRQEFSLEYPLEESQVAAPASLNEMILAAEKLSSGHSFLRVDFYEVDGQPKFGEMTLFPESGHGKFTPLEWENKFGTLWRDFNITCLGGR